MSVGARVLDGSGKRKEKSVAIFEKGSLVYNNVCPQSSGGVGDSAQTEIPDFQYLRLSI
jgi:hypothetical protein